MVSTEIKRSTRHLVKKQLTWFRRDLRIYWLAVTHASDRTKALEIFASDLRQHYEN